MPPPKTNFETLQDLLLKRKGMSLDVSSSKALATSLDACVVSGALAGPLTSVVKRPTLLAGPVSSRVQHIGPNYGDEMYAGCRVLLRRQCFQGHFRSLRISHANLHALHCEPQDLRGVHCRNIAYSRLAYLQSPIRRYADVLAHRQLAAAVGYTTLHPSLQSKSHVEKSLNVVNKRHRLAQMAGRASVEFYTGLALKARGKRAGRDDGGVNTEEAFVIRVFRNGLAVFVSK